MTTISIVTHEDGDAFVPSLKVSLEAAGYAVLDHVPLLDALHADVVWCEWGNPHTSAVLKMNRNVLRRPTIVRVHRYEAYEPGIGDLPWGLTSCVVAPTNHIARKLAPHVDGVLAVPCGVDLEKFLFVNRNDQQWNYRIGMIGNVIPRKGHMAALDDMAKLPHTSSLHIAGQTYPTTDYHEALLDRIARLGLKHRVFFDGHVQDVAQWWRDKDLCWARAWHESGPYSVYEAAACGVPCRVASFPGCEHIPLWMLENFLSVPSPSDSAYVRAWVERDHDARKLAPHYKAAVERALENPIG